jgi:hypothetical protein
VSDHRDLALEQLAADEALLRERLESVEADRDTYREVALTAIAALAETTGERNQYRRRLHELQDEFSQFRARIMREDGAAA